VRGFTRAFPARGHGVALALATVWAGLSIGLAKADVESDKAAIAARIEGFAKAFNARDATGACAIFAPDLLSTVRGRADEGHDAVCKRIAAALADQGTEIRYAPDIHEIIVSGDLAVVRLVWNVSVRRGPTPAVSREPGIDVFRRQPDGSWAISRFQAFSSAPD
jgi:uncharacterized protein (TIGR02246 family)